MVPESPLKNVDTIVLILIKKGNNNLRGKHLIFMACKWKIQDSLSHLSKSKAHVFNPLFHISLFGHHGIFSRGDTTIIDSVNKHEIRQAWKKYYEDINLVRKNVVYIPERGYTIVLLISKQFFVV